MEFSPEIVTEMKEAVALLWRWRLYDPALAGNALWCWAANKPAKDIDLFVKDSWACQKNLKAHYGEPNGGSIGIIPSPGGYGSIDEGHPIWVYKTTTPSGKPVDVVVTRWTGPETISRFDYGHLKVAFGLTERNTGGAVYYARGQILKLHGRARPIEVINSKLQTSLWGNRGAATAIAQVVIKLDEELKLIRDPNWLSAEDLDRLDREAADKERREQAARWQREFQEMAERFRVSIAPTDVRQFVTASRHFSQAQAAARMQQNTWLDEVPASFAAPVQSGRTSTAEAPLRPDTVIVSPDTHERLRRFLGRNR